jgi:hypothetical protein
MVMGMRDMHNIIMNCDQTIIISQLGLCCTLVDFGGGLSLGVQIIVWTTPIKFILCTYVVREIMLHTWIMHLGSNCWSKLAFNAKKYVVSNG